MAFAIDLLKGAANLATGGLVNKVLDIGSNERQLAQQGKLMRQQVDFSKELKDYDVAKQLELWKQTGYGAQKKQMEEAGLNPALLYGMSGGGGQTAGAGGMAMPTQTEAADPNGKTANSIGMAIQMANLKLINAQADKAAAEADKTKGIDTTLGQTQNTSLLQGIENQKAIEALTKAETRLRNVQANVAQESAGEQVSTIYWNTQRTIYEAKNAMVNANISEAVISEKINIIKQQAIGAILQNAATKSQIQLNQAQIQKMAADVEQGWRQIAQGWSGLTNEQQKIEIQKFEANMKAQYPNLWEVIGRWGETGITGLTDILTLSTGGSTMKMDTHKSVE